MPELKSKDSILLYYPAEKIYRVLTDFASYPAWYPKDIKFSIGYLDKKVIGTTLSIQNSPFVKWEAKITGFKPNELIGIDYINGAWLGKTKWELHEKGPQTLLTYEIDLHVNKGWLRLLWNIINFGKYHSKQMHAIFKNLEKYLSNGIIEK